MVSRVSGILNKLSKIPKLFHNRLVTYALVSKPIKVSRDLNKLKYWWTQESKPDYNHAHAVIYTGMKVERPRAASRGR